MTQSIRHPTHPAHCAVAALLLVALTGCAVGLAQEQPAATLLEDFEQAPVGWELFGGAAIGEVEGGHALVFSGPGGAFRRGVAAGQFTLSFRYRPGQTPAAISMCASGEPPRHQEYQLVLMPAALLLARTQHERGRELGAAMHDFAPGTWYDVSVTASGGTVSISVDGTVLCSAEDALPLGPGGFGFLQGQGGGAAFDDIAISGPDLICTAPVQPTAEVAPTPVERARPEATATEAAPPDTQQPREQPSTPAGGVTTEPERQVTPQAEQPAATTADAVTTVEIVLKPQMSIQPVPAGSSICESFDGRPITGWEFSGGVKVQQVAGAGALICYSPGLGEWSGAGQHAGFTLTYRYQHGQGLSQVNLCGSGEAADRREYRLLIGGEAGVRLVKLSGGHEEELAAAAEQLRSRTWYDIRIQAMDGIIEVRIGGRPVLSAHDNEPLPEGTIGFGCLEGSGFAFDSIALTPALAQLPADIVLQPSTP